MESLAQEALRELRSDRCVCRRAKKPKESFCSGCYFALPPAMRKTLYRMMSEGYAEHWDEARDWLRINTERIPKTDQRGLFGSKA